MNDDARQQRFQRTHALLTATVRSCERLLTALLDARGALTSNDIAALNGAVSRKKIHLADLESHEKQRKSLLAACRHKDDLVSMQRFIDDNDSGKQLTELWARTIELLGKCRNANRTNGAIIAAQQRQRGEAMAVIRQEQPEPETYGPAGKTETTGQYRALAEV